MTGNYPDLFEGAFGDSEITSERLAVAIEHYLFSLISADSKFDQVEKGEASFTERRGAGTTAFLSAY